MAKLNPSDPRASDAFCGLIKCASNVFANRLILGGGYVNTAHHVEILDHLQALCKLIEPYDSQHISI